MKKAVITMLACYVAMISMVTAINTANAAEIDACSFEMNREITIQPNRLLVTNADGTKLEVTPEGAISVNGEPRSLSKQQTVVVADYSQQVRTAVPAIVDIALAGVELGLTAVVEVFSTITERPVSPALEEALANLRNDIATRMRHQDETVYLDGQHIASLDNAIAAFEPALESAMTTAISDMVFSLFSDSDADENAEDVGMFESIGRFAKRMDNMGDDLEQRLKASAQQLETRAEGLCGELKKLDAVEQRLQAILPELEAFDLLQPGHDAARSHSI